MADEATTSYDYSQQLQVLSSPSTPYSHPSNAKLESSDDLLVLPDPAIQLPAPRNFRSKKRNRVMQSCVACHAQKRKCDRKRPCTRCTEHGIAGQCVYQLEDPTIREGPDQDELFRLRSRVADLERTVRVLMQKPLSKRAAAALEVETDAILGTSSHRKRKIATTDPKYGGDSDRATKQFKSSPHVRPEKDDAEWLSYQEPAIAGSLDALSPFAPSPADSHYLTSLNFLNDNGIASPGDVPTPPYSTFPTPNSDVGSGFKRPFDPMQRRFSDGASLANMMSHTHMIPQSPDSMSPTSPMSMISPGSVVSPASVGSYVTSGGSRNQAPAACGCGMNPMGSEVLGSLQTSLEAAFDVIKTLPEHSHNLPCNVIFSMADLIDAIQGATSGTSTTAGVTATTTTTTSPPEPNSGPSSSHTSPLSDNGVSPVSTIATPPNYMLQAPSSHLPHHPPFHHSEVPTVSGFTSLSSWAAFAGTTSFSDPHQSQADVQPYYNGSSMQGHQSNHLYNVHGHDNNNHFHGHSNTPIPQMIHGYHLP